MTNLMSKMNYFIEKNTKKCNNLCGVLWALKFYRKRSKIFVNKSYRSVGNIEIVNFKLRRNNQSEFDTKDPTAKDKGNGSSFGPAQFQIYPICELNRAILNELLAPQHALRSEKQVLSKIGRIAAYVMTSNFRINLDHMFAYIWNRNWTWINMACQRLQHQFTTDAFNWA